jgi:hypothetical protein
MIKKLLVFCALCLTATSAMAEIVDGVRQRPAVTQFVDFQPDEVYYLYNVGARQFFCGGNDWNTRASVAPKGYKVKLIDIGDGTYELTDSVETQSAWKSTFSTEDAGAIWVDNSNETYRYWSFTKKDGAYVIENPGLSASEGKALGWNGNEADTRLYFVDPATAGAQWQFVTAEVHDAYQQTWEAVKDQYAKAAELKTYLDQAKAGGINVSQQEAVYLNEAATAEELEAATAAVQKAINDAAAGGATVDNPSDMTASIINPTFENASYDGWKGTAPNMTGSGAHGPANVPEHYNKTFDTYQDLSNMPKGVYALSANTFFRGSWSDYVNHTNHVAYLYARADGDTLTVEMANPWEAMNTEPMAGTTEWGVNATESNESHDGVTYYIPNDPSAFRLYAEKGYYQKQVFFALSGDDPVRIGVMKKSSVTGTDWCIFDNFKLTYYGGAPEAYQFWLSEMKKGATDYSSAVASKQYKDAYLAAYDVQVSNKDEAVAAMKAIQAAADAISANAYLWKQLQEESTKAYAFVMGEYDGLDAAYDLADYLEEVDNDMLTVDDSQKTQTNDELEAAIERIKQLVETVKTEAKNALKPGDDVTNYMTNPNFDQGTTGWTVVNNGGGNVQSTAGTFEAWHSTNFDVYQEVKGLPIGVYEISVQGYVRYLDGQDAINNKENVPDDIPIYVYMNDSKTKFANWFDYPQESGFYGAVSGATFLSDSEGFEYPDNTTAAAAAFSKGDYTRSAFGLVAQRGDSLRVGVKGNPSAQQFWPCFDNFKLTYRGYAADVVKPVLEEELAEAQTYTTLMTTAGAKFALDGAISVAQRSLNGDDGRELFNALSELTKAIAGVQDGNVACKELYAAAEELAYLAQEYAISPQASTARELVAVIKAQLEASAISENSIEDYMKKISTLELALQLPWDYQNATDENPANVTAFIKTPGFSKIVDGIETNSIDGWTATGHKFGNSDQLSALALESWESKLDIHQTIEGLPNGTYILKVNAWERTSNPTYLFAEAAGQTFAKELITQEAGLPEGYSAPSSLINAASMFDDVTYVNELVVKVTDGTLTIGIKKEETSGADWVVMDNFQLIYLGANSQREPDGDATPVEAVPAATVARAEYFTLDGRKAGAAQRGLLIRKATMTDGTVQVKKVIR